MKKLCICFAIFSLIFSSQIFAQTTYTIAPKAPKISDSIKPAISMYKTGDYTGALQELEDVLKTGEKNTLAEYYIALCYTKLGMKSDAQKFYKAVYDKNENMVLTYYSKRAIECLDKTDSTFCSPQTEVKEVQLPDENDDIGLFLYSGRQIHPTAMDTILKEKMEIKMQEEEYMRKQQNLENKKTDLGTPTNEEIASALNVLSKIGVNPFQQSQFNMFNNNPYMALGNNFDDAKMFLYSQMFQQQNLLNNYGI